MRLRGHKGTNERHRQNVVVCASLVVLSALVTVLNLTSSSGGTLRGSPWLGVVGVVVFGGLLVRELRNPDDPT